MLGNIFLLYFESAWAARLRRSSVRSSNRRRTSIQITGRSCCGTTMSSNRKTWPANWEKESGTGNQ